MEAVKCPVCNGSGTVQPGNESPDTVGMPPVQSCHGCHGKGWVEVSGTSPQSIFPNWYDGGPMRYGDIYPMGQAGNG